MTKFQFAQSASISPVEFTIDLASGLPENKEYESVYLRIDVSKKQNGTGIYQSFN
ncbi:MAG: hypothetical protein IPH18_07595 [Chitinophagaceae bacterium]|nr:hypothetical protein [Chitinophagaceae bacterium]